MRKEPSKRGPGYDERVRLIVSLTEGPRVLHVGACGSRRATDPNRRTHFLQAALVDAGFSVLATDVHEKKLGWLSNLGYETAHLDAERIPDGERFDSIVAGELIEHLGRPADFLEGCKKRLKSGGLLLLSTPQPFSPAYLALYAFRPGSFNPGHTCWFDRQTLGQLLERCGYRVEGVHHVDDLRHFGGSRKARIVARVHRGLVGFLSARFKTTLVVAARARGESSESSPET